LITKRLLLLRPLWQQCTTMCLRKKWIDDNGRRKRERERASCRSAIGHVQGEATEKQERREKVVLMIANVY
jgi:hypothetical protein